MNKKINSIVLFLIITVLGSAIFMTGCRRDDSLSKVETLVQGTLDAAYKGEAAEEYLELTGTTSDAIKKAFDESLKSDALFFCKYIGAFEEPTEDLFNALPKDTQDKVVNLYRNIYLKTEYEAKDPEKEEDGSYSIELTLKPLDVFQRAIDIMNAGEYEPYNDFVRKYNTGEISEEDFSYRLINVMVALLENALEEAQSKEPKVFILKVTQETEDSDFALEQNTLNDIKDSMIVYP